METTDNNHLIEPKILIVDDEPANVLLLETLLRHSGYINLQSTTDSRTVIELYREFQPDVILLDLSMPHLDGFEIMSRLRALIPAEDYVPILVLTALSATEAKCRALSGGANDFLTKPLDITEVVLRTKNLLETRRLHLEVRGQNAKLETTVEERTQELSRALAELKATQQQVIGQERLHAFGVMAGGVAHDFNNVLSVVLGFGEMVLTNCSNDPERESDVDAMRAIITAAQDGARMVTRLREFYRPQGDPDEFSLSIDLNVLAAQAVALTEPLWKTQSLKNGITIEARVAGEEPLSPISGDPAELREILTNLIFNAVPAMPAGGVITVRTRNDGDHVILEVTDTGKGMSDEVRRRCLEPFFTTKGTKGTGLGLAMVYGIAQRHNTTMEIESAVGQGTTFRFRFPAQLQPVDVEGPPSIVWARPLKILVVDDQPFICEILLLLLAEDCHVAEAVTDAAEALERIQSNHFDLVITDQAMPEMTGGQLAIAVKKHSPETRVMLLTGFGADECPAEGAEAIDFVAGKPVTKETLRQAIAKVTASPRHSEVETLIA